MCFPADVPLNESVRLVGDSGGSTPSRGHVEVLHKGEWGHVCRFGWSIEMAIVVCKQLGFPTAEGAFKVENNARDTSSIFLHAYGCNGNEVAIHYCYHRGWKKHKCQLSSGIAGVICTGACVRACVCVCVCVGRTSCPYMECLCVCSCVCVCGVCMCACVCACACAQTA